MNKHFFSSMSFSFWDLFFFSLRIELCGRDEYFSCAVADLVKKREFLFERPVANQGKAIKNNPFIVENKRILSDSIKIANVRLSLMDGYSS
jgi:hypothetical protein